MRVLLLSRYGRLGASSRVRSYQYLPYLRDCGIDVTVAPLFPDEYLQDLYQRRSRDLLRIAAAYCRRVWHLSSCWRFDLLWVEYELLPWLPGWAEGLLGSLGIPYLVDYDDAVFHRYDLNRNALVRMVLGKKIDRIMRNAKLVTVGSDYLAKRAYSAGARRVEHLPTTVDLDSYRLASDAGNSTYTIGWIGSPLTTPYLELARLALIEACRTSGAQLVLIGAHDVKLDGLQPVVRQWSETTEVAEIHRLDVGIMPLPDQPWERGKCGYKLIQYMGCGRPVVASPVGANAQIVDHGVNGFLARTTSDWIAALGVLRDVSLRARMGRAGRDKVEREYALQVTAPRLAALLRGASRGGT